jgi:hypothetical protein
VLRDAPGQPQVHRNGVVRHGDQFGLVAGGRQDAARVVPHGVGHRISHVEDLAAGGARPVKRRQGSGGDVPDVPARPQERPRADRDAPASRPDPAQDEFLAPLRVLLAVDRGQPQHGAAPVQVARLDVQFVVVVPALEVPAQRVPAPPYRRGLKQRHRLPALVAEQQLVGAVDIHAGQQDQMSIGHERQNRIRIRPGHRAGVHKGPGTQRTYAF